jgi:hypothetical protein
MRLAQAKVPKRDAFAPRASYPSVMRAAPE